MRVDEAQAVDGHVAPPPRTWKNLGIRFISAVLLGLICVIPFYFGGIAWAILVAIFSSVMMWEWVNMADPKPTRLAYILPMIGLCGLIYLSLSGLSVEVLGLGLAMMLIIALERGRREGVLWAGFGFAYIAVPAVLMIIMRGDSVGLNAPGFEKLIFIILTVAAADTGAYFGGSYFKGPKLIPRLSPNKTWSGLMSGLLSGAIMGAILAAFIGFSPLLGAGLALPVVLISVLGDFFESAIKRSLKVKDAGSVMPGHGGLLDRLDALMMAVMGVALILYLYPAIWPV